MSDQLAPFCPRYTKAVEIIGRRWTGGIIRALMTGATRFNQIAQTVDGLSDRLLSERLRELEMEGIIARTVTPSTPVLVEYTLTAMGRGLSPVVQSLAEWAEEWLPVPEPTEEPATADSEQ